MKEYPEYEDRHSKSRDKKHEKRIEQKLMRGNRGAVNEIQKAQYNRFKRDHKKGYEDGRD